MCGFVVLLLFTNRIGDCPLSGSPPFNEGAMEQKLFPDVVYTTEAGLIIVMFFADHDPIEVVIPWRLIEIVWGRPSHVDK